RSAHHHLGFLRCSRASEAARSQPVERCGMRMPLLSRALFTVSAIGLMVGAHVDDLSPSHIFNDRWPPHAKFHTGQTLSMSLLLSFLTIGFAWRRTSDQREAVLATAGFAVAYWVTQATIF